MSYQDKMKTKDSKESPDFYFFWDILEQCELNKCR